MKTTRATVLLLMLMSLAHARAKDIPGLMPVDVYLSCEKAGFETMKSLGGATKSWDCTRAGIGVIQTVSARSGSSLSVTTVEATAIFVGGIPSVMAQEATELLSWVSTLPYTDARPEKARQWVQDNIAKGGQISINGVIFKIEVTPKSRTLRLFVND